MCRFHRKGGNFDGIYILDACLLYTSKDSADFHPESNNSGALEMTEYEYGLLKEAYETTMTRTGEDVYKRQEYY